jgi:GT2 family glycosyltransferase
VIDVIIPVYKGARETRRCIDSVLGSEQREPFELVAVDDASPDPEIVAYLRDFAATGRITLVRSDTNTGFVRSVNRGMLLHPDRDVVLLNSDTEVANDWLDRLRKSACSSLDIGTATPFSNNATICTYPFPGWTGGLPGTLGLAALDRLFATTNAGRTVELPTAVGSCMYIRRGCLQQVGPFDAERFGRGYGEENDFCLRAASAGWRNVLAGDVFVFHEGAVSFTDERSERAQAALQALLEVHPDYPRLVGDFSLRDPPGTLREAVDAARIAAGAEEARHVLAEQAVHRAELTARFAKVEELADERALLVAELRRGLLHAEGLVTERNEEIAKLRGGLTHAEAVVTELDATIRQQRAELDRIHGFWLWRYFAFLMRRF